MLHVRRSTCMEKHDVINGIRQQEQRAHPSATFLGISVNLVDAIVIATLIVFGLCAVLFHQRTADFMGDDVYYADAARSLLRYKFYGVNGVPETSQPPGLSAL